MKRTLSICFATVMVLAGARWLLFLDAGARADQAASLNGDVNGDGVRDLSDVIYLLGWMFLGGSEPVAIADSALEGRVKALEDQLASPAALVRQATDELKSLSTGDEALWDFPAGELKKPDAGAGAAAGATFTIDGAPAGTVMGFRLVEGISVPPRLDIIAAIPAASVSAARPGAPLELVYRDGDFLTRFRGEVAESAVAGTDASSVYLRVKGFSKLNRLSRGRKSRIFQGLAIPDIVEQLLTEAGITPDEYLFIFEIPHLPLETVVQYQETDLELMSRLLDEEGIFYFFIHGAEGAVLHFGDGPRVRLAGRTLRYPGHFTAPAPGSGPYISQLHRTVSPAVGRVTVGDFDPVTAGAVFGLAGAAGAGDDFEFGVNLFDPGSLDALAGLRLVQQEAGVDRLRGASSVPDLRPGAIITVDGAGGLLSGKYYVVGVTHQYVRGRAAPDDYYGNSFEGVPDAAAYLPPRPPRAADPGPQSAIVIGPPGQKTYTDDLGRVKVRFPWLPAGTDEENSSAWIRVSQNLPAGTPGSFLPEVGDEVLVAFEHGDPDRPIVLGALWNGKKKPPN